MSHLHGGANTFSADMDELAAAAAVLAMDTESNAEEDEELEPAVDLLHAREEQPGTNVASALEKAREHEAPEPGAIEAAHPKVMAALITLR